LDGEKATVQPASEAPEEVRGIDLLVRGIAEKMKVKLPEAQAQPLSKMAFRPVEPQAILPERDEKYPFLVVSQPTCFNPEWKVLRVQPEVVEISPPDAERLGLKESQRVTVRFREERLERVARIGPAVQEETVYIPDFKICTASLEVR
jgi:anaerobic selenocysteine-containing dehydrogenase